MNDEDVKRFMLTLPRYKGGECWVEDGIVYTTTADGVSEHSTKGLVNYIKHTWVLMKRNYV
jgi:hypothetical protein